MQIVVLGKNISNTQALRNYVEEKFSNSLLSTDPRISQVYVNLIHERKAQIVKLHLNIPGRKTLAIKEKGDDMYQAINGAVSQLRKKVSKCHQKKRSQRRSER